MDIRSETEAVISSKLEELMKAKPGSDEEQKLAGSIERLYKVWIEDVYKEENLGIETDKLDIEKRKLELDIQDKNIQWYERIKPDTVISCSTVVILTGLAFKLEKDGFLLPKQTMKFIDKLKLF